MKDTFLKFRVDKKELKRWKSEVKKHSEMNFSAFVRGSIRLALRKQLEK